MIQPKESIKYCFYFHTNLQGREHFAIHNSFMIIQYNTMIIQMYELYHSQLIQRIFRIFRIPQLRRMINMIAFLQVNFTPDVDRDLNESINSVYLSNFSTGIQ